MSLFLAVLVVVVFAVVVQWTGVASRASEAVRRARGSYAVVADRSLSDEQKERRLKEEAPRLFGLVGLILGGSALALGLPLGLLWLGDRLGLVSLAAVMAILVRVDFLVAVTGVGMLTLWWTRRRRR